MLVVSTLEDFLEDTLEALFALPDVLGDCFVVPDFVVLETPVEDEAATFFFNPAEDDVDAVVLFLAGGFAFCMAMY